MKALILFMRAEHLPKAPPPNTIIFGVRTSIHKFAGEGERQR